MMDRRFYLCSASLVLMLVCFDECGARPWWAYRNDPVDREEKEQSEVQSQELRVLKEVLERDTAQREFQAFVERMLERDRMEREQVEREQVEREEVEGEQGEREQVEREQVGQEQVERKQVEREQVEREQVERELEERQLEYGREQLLRQRRREVHAQVSVWSLIRWSFDISIFNL